MNKIIVIGNNGSGKSVFSAKLGKRLGLPVVHLDKLFHKPNWKRPSDEEWDLEIKKLVKRKKWIIDGTYFRTIDIRLKAADTIIFLNLPKWLCLYRAIKRRIIYRNKTRPDLPKYLSERLSLRLLKKIVFFSKSATLDKINQNKKGKRVIILHSQKEVDRFLYEI